MNAKFCTTVSTLALLLQAGNLCAQQVAPPAPAAAPPAPAVQQPIPAGDGGVVAVQPREAPSARNQVQEAFTPQRGGLTANDVAKRATASSYTIAAKNAELRAAAAKVDSAMYQFLPRASLKASYTRLSKVSNSLGSGYLVGAQTRGPYDVVPVLNANGDPVLDAQGNPRQIVSGIGGAEISFPSIVNSYSLSASLGVPLSDYVFRMSDSIKGTKLNREAAELNIQAEHAKVEGDARVAFFNWVRAIGQVAVTEKSVDRVKARLKDVESSFTVGLVTKAEVLRMQALVAATEAGLETARGFRELASQQLAVIMSDKQANYVLGEDVLAQPAKRPVESLERLVAEGQQKRLELQSLNRTVQSLEKAESVVRAGEYPRIDGFADFTYANPNQRYLFSDGWHHSWAAGVQATWTINDVLTSRASANEFKANRETIEANRNALAQGVRMEVTAAYTDGRRADAELEAARRSAEASEAAYDISIQLYKVGKATTSDLIDAEAELVTSNLRLINAHIDTKLAETKLARATGRDLTKLSN